MNNPGTHPNLVLAARGKMAVAKTLSKSASLKVLGLAVLVVVAGAYGVKLILARNEAASPTVIEDAEREAFIKQHYPIVLSAPTSAIRHPGAGSKP